jgi:DNA-binding XRE family transcriptional regulator
MMSDEMKAIRRGTGLSQEGIANKLGISRKTVNEMENGAPIDRRTELAMQTLARTIKLISDVYYVEDSIRNTYLVVRRTLREYDSAYALYSGHSELMLYGEFNRRGHAERWWKNLNLSNNPRNTRKLLRERKAEFDKHQQSEAA